MNPLNRLLHLFRRESQTLQKRLIGFFLVFLIAVMAGIFLILIITGVFSAGLKESRAYLNSELTDFAGDIGNGCGTTAVEGLALSKKLSEQIARSLAKQNRTPADLADSPECLNPVLSECLDTLQAALGKTDVSGAFVILDATVNPALENAEHSRAGLFLKNMEPNAANRSDPEIRYVRGPASIARANSLTVLPQWHMEFTTSEGDFFHKVVTRARNTDLPLSRLYYWSPKFQLADDYEESLLLVVPLFTEDRKVLGVCGFEINSMLFKLQHAPDSTLYPRTFSMLSPVEGQQLNSSGALLARNYSAVSDRITGMMAVSAGTKDLSHFTAETGDTFDGVYKTVILYPKDSAYADENWAVAVMVPHDDLAAHVNKQNTSLFTLLACLLVISAATAIAMSRRYLSPVLAALQHRDPPTVFRKTNIQEIDDLFQFLATQDIPEPPNPEPIESEAHTTALFETFLANIQSLSPAERAVFNLYQEGYTAKEITDILCLSINTIKTHNKRIYMKLNVESRSELMLYLSMLKEKGNVLT